MGPLSPAPMGAGSDTVYLCVVDEDLCAVSFINSLFSNFRLRAGRSQQRRRPAQPGHGFRPRARAPNCIGPGKRPLHTLIPGMLTRDGQTVMPFGVMGGQYQAVGHAYLLSNLFDFGLDVQEAIDLARVFAVPDGEVEVESGVPSKTVRGLRKLGHETGSPEKPIGGGQGHPPRPGNRRAHWAARTRARTVAPSATRERPGRLTPGSGLGLHQGPRHRWL